MTNLIGLPFRMQFREFCSNHLVLRHIHAAFRTAGFVPSTRIPPDVQGQRRTVVAQYEELIDWDAPADAERYLTTVGLILAQIDLEEVAKEQLRQLCHDAGFVVEGYTIRFKQPSGMGDTRMVVFAAEGYKPDIVIRDLTTLEVEIVEGRDRCLVYDRPIPSEGLRWTELVVWWQIQHGTQSLNPITAEQELAQRLYRGLGSDPERYLLNTYFLVLRGEYGAALPAIFPQVYLHYDPYTLKQRGGTPVLERQRMDFLFFLPGGARVVVEIDGKQHYAEDSGQASPRRYAAMVAEDRRLRLAGYEIFRFGGYELIGEMKARELFTAFFRELFTKYNVSP